MSTLTLAIAVCLPLVTVVDRDRTGEEDGGPAGSWNWRVMVRGMDAGDGPREVLERLRRVSIEQSERRLAEVYAVDAVHEFPFRPPGVPARLEGREEIVNFVTAGWRGGVPKYDSYRTVAVHETGDPQTLVVEQEAVGVSASGRAFALPNIMVLTVVDGRIAHLRDYVDVMAAMAVIEEAESPVA